MPDRHIPTTMSGIVLGGDVFNLFTASQGEQRTLGMKDSEMGKLAQRINADFGTDLTKKDVQDAVTIDALVRHVERQSP